MNAYKLGAAVIAGFIIAAGCGDSDETGSTSGGSNSGSGGGAADASTSTGGTSTGGTSTGGTGGTSVGTGGGAADAGAQCATNSDCTAPLYCVNGSCVECATNGDCVAPLICVSGGCVECGTNTDCTAPEQCVNGACVGCVDNTSCPSGQFCVGGTCTSGCGTDADCPSGDQCVGGVCLGTECTTNDDCTAPEQCVLGRCGTVIVAACQGHVYQCGDGLDNDSDGLTDMNDPDCLGPCSNTESNFHNCIPGGGSQACQADCYFDPNSGSGDDTCVWDHRCDPLETAEGQECPYACGDCDLSTQTVEQCIQACDTRPAGLSGSNTCASVYASQSATCEAFCGPITPNGCDCFGCCDVLGDGDYRFMGSTSNDQRGDCDAATCTLDAAIAKDDAACKKCTPVASCLNTCDKQNCECCLAGCDLPDSCNQPPPGTGGTGGSGGTTGGTGGSGGTTCPTPLCPTGVQSCGVSCLPPCPTGFYCSTGCCRPIPA